MGFFRDLEQRTKQVNSILCVGLDPHIVANSSTSVDDVLNFCNRIISSTSDAVAAYKPNSAFFEALGPGGLQVLQQVIQSIPDGIPIILDAKRGDIASTASAYAKAVFDVYGADCVTLNPYLGYDAIEPFLRDERKGVFLLCKTSNPGAADLQDLPVQPGLQGLPDKPYTVYETVAMLARRWNQKDNIGLVVGATHLESLLRVRTLCPDMWFLCPGVGAQGGDLEGALSSGLRSDGLGMLVSVSRSISAAEDPGLAVEKLNTEIQHAIDTINHRNSRRSFPVETSPVGKVENNPELALVADRLLAAGCVLFGDFELKSGLRSPIYIDLRRIVSQPELMRKVTDTYNTLLDGLEFDLIAGLPYAALPIATSISLARNYPMVYPRKEVKQYGTKIPVEGVYKTGDRVVLIDDLATTGGSKFEAIEILERAGLVVEDVVVLIDRQSNAADLLAERGYRLHAVFQLTDLIDYWEDTGQVDPENITAARRFLQETG